ncbi:MAG: hypothetical protein MUC97_13120 [Bernardetiaceae bacterium]|nr:hypothetical protein [Bernardetiaceae bacterium]
MEYHPDYRPQFGSADFPRAWEHDFEKRDFARRGRPAKLIGTLPGAALVDGQFADYIVNSGNYNLCSQKLRDVVEAGSGPDDVVEWYPVTVNGLGQSRTYYVLHLPVIRPVLDERHSKFRYLDQEKIRQILGVAQLPGIVRVRQVIQYSFNADALKGCHVFGREDSSLEWFVSGKLKRAIEAAGCTGLEFDQVEAYPQTPGERAP